MYDNFIKNLISNDEQTFQEYNQSVKSVGMQQIRKANKPLFFDACHWYWTIQRSEAFSEFLIGGEELAEKISIQQLTNLTSSEIPG